MTDKKKIQVNISKEAEKEIEELKNKLNLSSIPDVIRSSLTLAKYIELEKEAGSEIIVRDKETKKAKFKKAYNEIMFDYADNYNRDIIVKVNWKDAITYPDVCLLKDIRKERLADAVTIGYLILDDEEKIGVCGSIFHDGEHDIQDPQGSTGFKCFHFIPKKLIKSILVLKIDFEESKKYQEKGK